MADTDCTDGHLEHPPLVGAGGRVAPLPAPAAHGIVTSPVHFNGEVVGALALRLADAPSVPVASSAQPPSPETPQLLALLESVLGAADLRQAVTELANRLCVAFGCDRMMIGLSTGRSVRVRGMSHGSDVGARSSWMRAVGAVMDEAAARWRRAPSAAIASGR